MVCCSKKILRFGNGAILVCAISKTPSRFFYLPSKNNPGEEGRTKREKNKKMFLHLLRMNSNSHINHGEAVYIIKT